MAKIVKKSGEQKAAEADVEDFKEDLGPFVVAAEKTRMAMVFTDAKELENVAYGRTRGFSVILHPMSPFLLLRSDIDADRYDRI